MQNILLIQNISLLPIIWIDYAIFLLKQLYLNQKAHLFSIIYWSYTRINKFSWFTVYSAIKATNFCSLKPLSYPWIFQFWILYPVISVIFAMIKLLSIQIRMISIRLFLSLIQNMILNDSIQNHLVYNYK